MRNISFDNPWLLLLCIPFFAAILVPFFLSFKGRKTKNVIVSLILHLLVSLLLVFSFAGMTLTTVITETNVYVLADVSYSANRNLDTIDAYVEELQHNLPANSKLGLVCFGKDYQLVSGMGEEIKSVKQANVDDTATDMISALNYTATLFEENVIKRIVIITDGKDTDTDATGKLITAIDNLHLQNIRVDAIYMDNNLPDQAKEVQINDVEYTQHTYVGREVTANVSLQSSYDGRAIVSLYQSTERIADKAVELTKGYNIVDFKMPTETAGTYDYEIRVEAEQDETTFNNRYCFTQEVSDKIKVLLIAPTQEDQAAVERIYGENVEMDAYINRADVPHTVEALSKYDEIVLSNTDVRTLHNTTAFIDSVDKVVSLFGKSFVTIGNTDIQNKADEADLSKLEDMLPVRFGNSDQDPKLYGIVIDTSRSMQMASRLLMLKEAATQLLELLNPEDMVTVVTFSGDVTVLQAPTKAKNREAIAKLINDAKPSQGTYLGKGMQTAYELMKNLPYSEKQVVLISDGASYGLEPDDPVSVAGQMRAEGILTTVIDPRVTDEDSIKVLKNIAKAGAKNGNEADYAYENYYVIENEESVKDLIFNQVADDFTESVIHGYSVVNVKKIKDDVMQGVSSLPAVYGYVYSKAKASATTVLTTVYERESGNVEAPIYAYWKYGNGKVASFTSTISGEWAQAWSESADATAFLTNVIRTNVPEERSDYPYSISIEYDGKYLDLEITPAVLNPYATAEVRLTLPNGESVEERLTFDSTKYFRRFEISDLGKYEIDVTYTYNNASSTSKTPFHVSYYAEHDRFAAFDASTLYSTIGNRGTVSEDTVPKLENDKGDVATYEVSFTLPFMITAIVLYVADVIVRKLKWKDVVSFFKKKKKGGARV